jgi:hypothetical protein
VIHDHTADACVYRWTSDADMLAIRMEHERREEMIADWHAEQDRAEYEQAKGSANVVAWLVATGLVLLFLALAAIWGA